MAVDPVNSPSPSAAPPTGAPAGAQPPRDFAAVLQAQLDEPRSALAEVRANIAAIRSGRMPAPSSSAGRPTGSADIQQRLQQWSQHGTGAADPYGWRALTRTIGDATVAPGFGTLFERQMQQESGFDPQVVLGQRVSSAGAEGIAQLMPQYYPGVDRTDPQSSLVAAADTMRRYLATFDGDVRKALAAYNTGLGRVQQLVQAHGADWERALPQETKQYLAAIVGDAGGRITPTVPGTTPGVFGGRGPGGVLTSPLDSVLGKVSDATALALRGLSGADVRAPADGVVTSIGSGALGSQLTLDNGNGWQTVLDGLGSLVPGLGDYVPRGSVLGALGAGDGSEAALRLGVVAQGQPVDPRAYLLGG